MHNSQMQLQNRLKNWDFFLISTELWHENCMLRSQNGPLGHVSFRFWQDLPYKVKMQYLQIYKIVDTALTLWGRDVKTKE